MKPAVRLLALTVAAYVLQQASQVALTPAGEGMDFYGHLAYIVFYAEQNRQPLPEENSVPPWIDRLQQDLPAPDPSADATRYRRWASLTPAAREALNERYRRGPDGSGYLHPNYQSQHPPLYYRLASGVYRLVRNHAAFDTQVYLLTLFSLCLTALAFPALYATLRLYLDEAASLLVLLSLAWYPNLMPFLGRVTNDTLAFPLIAWAVFFCLRSQLRPSTGAVVFGGVLLALAGFTKTYALTLWPVYLACAVANKAGVHRSRAGLAFLASLVGVGSLLTFNRLSTGHWILLEEMRSTVTVSVLERLAGVLALDPVWFFGGLAKGFWWSGYWSFVSPGSFYYVPMGLVLSVLLLKRPLAPSAGTFVRLWPHLLALAGFYAGMAWHAASFRIYATQHGEAVHSGNEGWYANVLIGCVAVIVASLLKERLPERTLVRSLAAGAIVMAAWNLLARLSLGAYWSGSAGVADRLRGIRWGQALSAWTESSPWDHWRSLPGVIGPAPLTVVLPLLAAISLSLCILTGCRGLLQQGAPETVDRALPGDR